MENTPKDVTLTVEQIKEKYKDYDLGQLKFVLIAIISEYTHEETRKVRKAEVKSGNTKQNIFTDYELVINTLLDLIHAKLIEETGELK